MFLSLCNAYNMLFGANSALIAFVAGASVLVFFVVLALNEGNQMLSWAMKIMIGVAGLIGVSSLLQTVFPGMGAC